MTLLSIMSDLHLEFADIELPGGDILILAGDIWTAKHMSEDQPTADRKKLRTRYIRFCQEELKKYERVFMVMGNHEHYGMNIAETPRVIHTFLHEYAKNASLLDNDLRLEYDFLFIGSTLWANYGCPNPVQEQKIANYMNDCRLIRIYDENAPMGERIIRPQDIHVKHHKKSKYALYRMLNGNVGVPKVLITHHAPSWHSQRFSPYESSDLDFAYYTNLEKAFAKKYRVKVAIHGHTHQSCTYQLGSTVVTSNQRGYKGVEACSQEFDPQAGDIELAQLLENEKIAHDPRFAEGDDDE